MFAAIWTPRFRLQAAQRWRDEPPAVALIDSARTRALILEVSPAAQEQGVRPGITAAQGLARCPGLRILPRCLSQEEACSALLIETASSFSPKVEATGPDTATIDLRNLRKNACWLRMGDEMVRRLLAEGLSVLVGFAGNANHALLAARSTNSVNVIHDGPAFCATLPISALEPDERILAILNDWGIRTIGEMLRLPKADVIARLGPEAEQMWNRASGRSKRLLRLVQPPESFVEAFDFEYPVETTEPLLFLLRRFLESLCSRIRDQHRVVGRMLLTMPLDDGSRHEREFGMPAPTSSVDVLYRILDTHLESLRLAQQPSGIRLELFTSPSLVRQLALFEKGLHDPNGFGETLGRLQALVGEGGVGMPDLADTHRPEALRMTEFEESNPISLLSIQFGFPLRRLRPPVTIGVRLFHFVPAWVDASDWAGPISQASGPYRFSGNWWSEAPWAIEEWDVQIEGRGLVRLGRRDKDWTVEGIYNLSHGCHLH